MDTSKGCDSICVQPHCHQKDVIPFVCNHIANMDTSKGCDSICVQPHCHQKDVIPFVCNHIANMDTSKGCDSICVQPHCHQKDVIPFVCNHIANMDTSKGCDSPCFYIPLWTKQRCIRVNFLGRPRNMLRPVASESCNPMQALRHPFRASVTCAFGRFCSFGIMLLL